MSQRGKGVIREGELITKTDFRMGGLLEKGGGGGGGNRAFTVAAFVTVLVQYFVCSTISYIKE